MFFLVILKYYVNILFCITMDVTGHVTKHPALIIYWNFPMEKSSIMTVAKARKYRGITIRKRGSSWQVDYGSYLNKRVQRSYPTLSDAQIEIDKYKETQRFEDIANKNKRIQIHDLTDNQRRDVFDAYEKLKGKVKLCDVVDFYLKHNKPENGDITISTALDEYLQSKKRANKRKRTLNDIQTRIGRLARDFSHANVCEITSRDLESWLNKHNYIKVSRLNYRTAFIGFFNFCKKQGYVSYNPAESIERPTLDETIPNIFRVEDVKKLIYTCAEYYPRMIPYFALCTWAGLRASETQQLDWSQINLNSMYVTIIPEVAKKRRQRHVEIAENLLQWLVPP